jgi:hypothetical protein
VFLQVGMSLNQNWSTDEIANADRIAGANSLVPNLGGELDLQKSLISLSLLPTGVGQVGLESLLRQIAEFAVRAIPGADGAGLTLLETGRADTIVSTSKFAEDVGTLQVSVGEGPSPSAIAERRTVRCGSLGEQPQWAKFGPRVIRLGVHSAMSLPLRAADDIVGTLDVYAFAADAFDDRAILFGELFSIPAAMSVRNAQILSQAQRLAVQLEAALTSRAVIDQALGMVMARAGCTAEEAFDKLRTISQAENRRLALVAQRIIDEAVRRVRARRAID